MFATSDGFADQIFSIASAASGSDRARYPAALQHGSAHVAGMDGVTAHAIAALGAQHGQLTWSSRDGALDAA